MPLEMARAELAAESLNLYVLWDLASCQYEPDEESFLHLVFTALKMTIRRRFKKKDMNDLKMRSCKAVLRVDEPQGQHLLAQSLSIASALHTLNFDFVLADKAILEKAADSVCEQSADSSSNVFVLLSGNASTFAAGVQRLKAANFQVVLVLPDESMADESASLQELADLSIGWDSLKRTAEAQFSHQREDLHCASGRVTPNTPDRGAHAFFNSMSTKATWGYQSVGITAPSIHSMWQGNPAAELIGSAEAPPQRITSNRAADPQKVQSPAEIPHQRPVSSQVQQLQKQQPQQQKPQQQLQKQQEQQQQQQKQKQQLQQQQQKQQQQQQQQLLQLQLQQQQQLQLHEAQQQVSVQYQPAVYAMMMNPRNCETPGEGQQFSSGYSGLPTAGPGPAIAITSTAPQAIPLALAPPHGMMNAFSLHSIATDGIGSQSSWSNPSTPAIVHSNAGSSGGSNNNTPQSEINRMLNADLLKKAQRDVPLANNTNGDYVSGSVSSQCSPTEVSLFNLNQKQALTNMANAPPRSVQTVHSSNGRTNTSATGTDAVVNGGHPFSNSSGSCNGNGSDNNGTSREEQGTACSGERSSKGGSSSSDDQPKSWTAPEKWKAVEQGVTQKITISLRDGKRAPGFSVDNYGFVRSVADESPALHAGLAPTMKIISQKTENNALVLHVAICTETRLRGTVTHWYPESNCGKIEPDVALFITANGGNDAVKSINCQHSAASTGSLAIGQRVEFAMYPYKHEKCVKLSAKRVSRPSTAGEPFGSGRPPSPFIGFPCRHFVRGSCERGHDCSFLHVHIR
ncbi:hypothetical protein DIPPA_11627 [Diplonema papillatum]|nr:hypothetical protein DIPPA_11627 [Diplonema papillatum]